jgi:lipoprotein-releasing system permease protein
VLAVQPFIFAEMLVTRGKGELSGVAIKGIDPTLVAGVLDLDKYIQKPATLKVLEDRTGDAPPIIIGTELAHKLKARVGDDITVVVPLSNIDLNTMHAATPHTKRFRIAGLFYRGFDEYDRRLVYATLKDTQDLLGRNDQVMGVEMKVRDLDRADEIAHKLDKALGGPPFQVQDWYELNRNLFTALNVQKVVLAIILTLIIIVAAVNMVSALTMMVTDKTREIAILKSMGGTSGSIAQVFQVVGIAIGGAGTIVGVAIGLAVCAVVSAYGFHLDPKVYLIDELPVVVRPLEVILVAAITMVISVVTTVIPAWTASALTPLEGLRYD